MAHRARAKPHRRSGTALERGRQEALCEGLCKGIALSLEIKFGPGGRKLMRRVRAIENVARLEALSRALKKVTTLEEVRELLPKATNGS